jgi:hypothetical protein
VVFLHANKLQVKLWYLHGTCTLFFTSNKNPKISPMSRRATCKIEATDAVTVGEKDCPEGCCSRDLCGTAEDCKTNYTIVAILVSIFCLPLLLGTFYFCYKNRAKDSASDKKIVESGQVKEDVISVTLIDKGSMQDNCCNRSCGILVYDEGGSHSLRVPKVSRLERERGERERGRERETGAGRVCV